MIRRLCCLLLFILTPACAMLRTQGRAPSAHRASSRPIPSRVRPACPRNLVRSYSTNGEWEEHEAQSNAKRQEAWGKISTGVAERISELKAKGKKHRALAAQHANYARAFETLAELEKDNLTLFKLTIDKLNSVAVAFEHGDVEPTLDKEANLLKVLTETYEEFYNALPEDEKI